MEFNATFLVSAISFIVFTFVMNKIFYNPLGRVISERQKFLDETKNDALFSNNKAEAILKDRDDKLSKSVADAKRLVADKVNEANENSRTLTGKAKQKSMEEITSAKLSLHDEANQSKEELKNKVKDLAEVISSKVLGIDVKIDNTDNEIVNRILN